MVLLRIFPTAIVAAYVLKIVSALRQPVQTIQRTRVVAEYSGYIVPSYYFQMPVDHFNHSDTRTYNNRYYLNDTYYRPGGPVFFFDNGETGIQDQWAAQVLAQVNVKSAVMILAQQYHAIVVLWEHRYYGFSQPVPITYSEDRKSFYIDYTYLTLEQALEDVVYFAQHWQSSGCIGDDCDVVRPSKVPWIWFGGSYAGARGAFMRIRNPEIFYAVWASSAPVQAMEDGSPYFTAIAASLPSNCSRDVEAAVRLADEIMSGMHGEELYKELQKLSYLTVTLSHGLKETYNIDQSSDINEYSIASQMAENLYVTYQFTGASGSTDIFCNFLESYNPHGSSSDHSNPWISILSAPGDGRISDQGIAATYGDSVALVAYFWASRTWWEWYYAHTKSIYGSSSVPVDNPIDVAAWEYQTLTEFGWHQGSNPDNITIISKYSNYAITKKAKEISLENFTNITFDALADVTKFNKYGGWNMTPSNVMFTDGGQDPWRAGTVMSQAAWIGAPLRELTAHIPACNRAPNGMDIFGLVYPDRVHGSDLVQGSRVPYDERSPVYQGVQLFSRALAVWLPCYKADMT